MRRTLGQYEIKERVAVGGVAQIHLAVRPAGLLGIEQRVAVKTLLPQHADNREQREHMVEEARLLAQLDHPNLIKVHDLGEDDGTLYMVMDYVEGWDLSKLLKMARSEGVQIPFDVAAFITAELCSALHYAHTATGPDGRPIGLVHRDVSPQNVLVGAAGEVKLVDFGVAKSAGGVPMDTKTGIIKGKIAYMAPEYAIGALQDQRSDIFSAGLCLYEMVAGRHAYDVTDPARMLDGVKNAKMASPRALRPDTPDELTELMSRALKRSPADRYATAAEMQRALVAFVSSISPAFDRAALADFVRALAAGEIERPALPAPVVADVSSEHPVYADPHEVTAAHYGLADLAGPEDPTEANHGLAGLAFSSSEVEDAATAVLASEDPTEGLAGLADLAREAKITEESEAPDIAVLETMAMEDVPPHVPTSAASDAATDTEIDVHSIRGDRRPEILTQSGFVRLAQAADVDRYHRGAEPSDRMPAVHSPRPDDPHGFEGEATQVGTPSHAAAATPAHAPRPPTGRNEAVPTPAQASTPTAPRPKPPTAAIPRTVPKKRTTLEKLRAVIEPTDWSGVGGGSAEEEPQSMLDTGRALANRSARNLQESSRTEPGRRRNDAVIVAVLGFVFIAIIVYTFFVAS